MRLRQVALLFLMLLFIQMNCFALPLSNSSKSVVFKEDQKTHQLHQEDHNVSEATWSIKEEIKDMEMSLSWKVVVSMAFVFIASPLFAQMLLCFLRDQPLTKQCTMNYLYQDLIKAHLGFIWLWSLSGIIMKINLKAENDDFIKQFVISFVLVSQALFLLVFLYICLIGALRMYSAKVNTLDPLEEILGGNDNKTIQIVRILIWSVVAFVVILYWCSSTRPLVYYQICEQKDTLTDLPTRSLILFFFDLGLCIFSVFLHMMVKIYQYIEDAKLRHEMVELDKQLNNNFGNTKRDSIKLSTVDDPPNDSPYPYSVYRSTLPVVLYIGNSITIVLMLLLRYFGVGNINFWWVMAAFTGNQGVIFPLSFILFYREVRVYSCRRLNYYLDAFVNHVTKIKNRFKRRSLRRVIPYNINRNEMN